MNLLLGCERNKAGCMHNHILEPSEEEKKEYMAYKSEQDFFDNLNGGMQQLEETVIPNIDHIILVCGGMAGFDSNGLLDFINAYSEFEKKRGKSLVLLSEVTAEYRRYTAQKVKLPFLCTPHLLAKEIIVLGLNVTVSDSMMKFIRKKKYIREAVELIKARHPKVGKGYAEAWAYYAYQYIDLLLRKIKPEKVILWNKFYAFHHIFNEMCKERKVLTEYMEFGCLPGTISIDCDGQMGESYAARDYKKFRELPVSESDISCMAKILLYLKESGLNRNEQPKLMFEKKNLYTFRLGRPLVVYFGQNDYESGLYPYTRNARKNHSPIFKSTIEAMNYLILLSIKNSWNLVYKPHPIIKSLGLELDENSIDKKIYMTDDVNINSLIDNADVIVTIFSQSAYIALIRDKPVVMLGYTQLRGKGCTYEAFCKYKIEGEVQSALKRKFTAEQKQNFIKHCAQLKKYYLIDDLQHKEYLLGRNLVVEEE